MKLSALSSPSLRAVVQQPQVRAKAVASVAQHFGAQWSTRHMPLVTAALDILQTEDANVAERCRFNASEPGALVRLVDQLSLPAGHMADVAEALVMTVGRIRSVTHKSHGQPA